MIKDLKLYFENREKINDLNQFIIQFQLEYNKLNELKELTLNAGYLYDIKIDRDLDFLQQEIENNIEELNEILSNIKDKKLLKLLQQCDNLYLSKEDIEDDKPCLSNRTKKDLTQDKYNFINYILLCTNYRSSIDRTLFNDLLLYILESKMLDEDIYIFLFDIHKKSSYTKYDKSLSLEQYIDNIKQGMIKFTPLQVFSILHHYDIISDNYFEFLIRENFIKIDNRKEMYHTHLKNIGFILLSHYNKKQHNDNVKMIVKSIDEESYLDYIKL